MKDNQNSNQAVAVAKGSELFLGFNVGESVAKAMSVKHVVKASEPVLVKNGKKKGQPVLKKDGTAKMRPSQDYTVISFLPAESKGEGKESIASRTGMKGQELLTFEREAQREASESYLRFIAELIASGQYDISRARRNNKTRVISSTIKPAKEVVVPVISQEDALKVLGLTPEQYARFTTAKPAKVQ